MSYLASPTTDCLHNAVIDVVKNTLIGASLFLDVDHSVTVASVSPPVLVEPLAHMADDNRVVWKADQAAVQVAVQAEVLIARAPTAYCLVAIRTVSVEKTTAETLVVDYIDAAEYAAVVGLGHRGRRTWSDVRAAFGGACRHYENPDDEKRDSDEDADQ